jgi:hypothetical protein
MIKFICNGCGTKEIPENLHIPPGESICDCINSCGGVMQLERQPLKEGTTPITSDKEDKGAHYRFMFKGVKFDPYRICKMYGVGGGPREHMLKKILRGSGKGHTEDDLIKELQCCLDRWKEMIKEDKDA